MEGTIMMEQSERGRTKQVQDLHAEIASFKMQLSLYKSRVAEIRDQIRNIRPKQN